MSRPGPEFLPDYDRRKPRAVLLLLAGVVLGSLLMLGLLASVGAIRNTADMRGGKAAESMPGSGGTSASMPDNADPRTGGHGVGAMGDMTPEQALRYHIPASINRSCEAGDRERVQSFSYFSVVCHPGGPVSQVQYSSFHDAEALRVKFSRDLSMTRVADKPSPQSCSTFNNDAYGRWWMEPGSAMAHRLSGDPMPGSTQGRLMCYWRGDHATIEWYDSDTHIYAWATTSQDLSRQLFDWWVERAGPRHPRAQAGGM